MYEQSRVHQISGKIKDENYTILEVNGTDGKNNKCQLTFEDQTAHITVKDDKLKVGFNYHDGPMTDCFEFELPEYYFDEDQDIYLFIAADSGMTIPNEHVVHEIRFKDTLHLHDSEDQDTASDKKPFFGKAFDVLRKGSII